MESSTTQHRVFFDGLRGLPGAGQLPNRRMIVGMAPSTRRPVERRLEPFGSASFGVIQSLSQRYPGIYITNLVKEPLVPGTKISPKMVKAWFDILHQEILEVKPERILTLGMETAKTLCPGFTRLREDHGTFFHNTDYNCWVVPTWHFAMAFHDPTLRLTMQRDLQRYFTLPDPEPAEYHLFEKLSDFRCEVGAKVYLDLESTGVELTDKITMIGLQAENHVSVSIFQNPSDELLKELMRYLSHQKAIIVGHNVSFDLTMIMNQLKGLPRDIQVEDTMLMAHEQGEEVLALKHLTSLRTDLPGSRSGGGYTDPLYLAEDVRSTKAIYHLYKPEAEDSFIHHIVSGLIIPITRMRVRGVYVDSEMLESLRAKTQREVKRLAKIVCEGEPNLNLNAPQQVADYLIRSGIQLTKQTETGAFSVAEAVLLDLSSKNDNPKLKALLEYRAAAKLLSGFIEPYQEILKYDGKLHPRLLLQGTATGRLSCSDPNLQQVPREGPLKQIFVPRPGFEGIMLCDLSQAELRVAALISGDDQLANALLSTDVHRRIASLIFQKPEADVSPQERKWSKRITFGVLYGGTAKGLSKTSGLAPAMIEQVLKIFNKEFPQLASWFDEIRETAETKDYVETLFGRRRSLVNLRGQEGSKGAYRKAVNTPVQSLANDVMLTVFYTLEKELQSHRMKSRPIFGVHDSLIVEVAEGESNHLPELVHRGFLALHQTPLDTIPLFKRLPLIGEMYLGTSWAATESTNENYHPSRTWSLSSHEKRPSEKKHGTD